MFLELQEEHFTLLAKMTTELEAAITVMQWRNDFETALLLARRRSVLPVRKKLLAAQQKIVEADTKRKGDGTRKEKLRLLVRKSRVVFGVCDQGGRGGGGLRSGQCALRITVGGVARTLTGRVAVARSPSYLPGDVRVLEAVAAPGLRHLVDCVVFPTVGERPPADEMAGGDLDGDKFFVCWDERLVPPEVRPAAEYPAAAAKKEGPVTHEAKIKYFSCQRNLQGAVDTLYNKWV